jgi:hypothetical protein
VSNCGTFGNENLDRHPCNPSSLFFFGNVPHMVASICLRYSTVDEKISLMSQIL